VKHCELDNTLENIRKREIQPTIRGIIEWDKGGLKCEANELSNDAKSSSRPRGECCVAGTTTDAKSRLSEVNDAKSVHRERRYETRDET